MIEFLKHLQNKQKELQNRLTGIDVTAIDSDQQKEFWTKENILSMHAELSELLDWTNWKHWKNTRIQYDENRIKEIHLELIDILHFWTNLCLIWGLTPEKIVEIYNEKNKENHNRQDRGY